MSKVSVRKAAKLTGKSRETINSATKDGTLSYSHNERGHKVIDISELERVYPIVKSIGEIDQESETVRSRQVVSDSDTTGELALLRAKLASSEQLRELLTEERTRERGQLEKEIETLRASLERVQDQHGKAMLLITDQTDGSQKRFENWEQTLRSLEDRLAKQEQKSEQYRERILRERQRAVKYKEALDAEKSRNIWQKLFAPPSS